MKIVFATDGSDFARAALDWLAKLLPRGSKIYLLSVCEIPELPSDEAAPGALAHLHDALHSETDYLLAGETQRLRAGGFEIEPVQREGRPGREIPKFAEEVNADLVALGSHSRTRFRELVLGSVSTKVLDRATCSVLVIRLPGRDAKPVEGPFKVLLAINRSQVAAACVSSLAHLGRDKDFQVDCLRVLIHLPQMMSELTAPSSSEAEKQRAAAEESLSKACQALREAGHSTRAHIVEGEDPAETIIECARKWSSQLVVIGSHEQTMLEKLLLGSVSSEVLHKVACSVLVVKGLGIAGAQEGT